MTDERDEIRVRVDIVDLISRRVALKRSGKGYTGLCPFHEDRNPSFFVDPRTGRYKCWSCGESGDVFTWVMKTEHVEFVDALRSLADAAGIKLTRSASRTPPSVRDNLRRAMAEALAFFAEELPKSEQAIAYCHGRGIDDGVIKDWELGYAPDRGEALAVRLKRAGVSLAEGKSLFLVDEDPSGGFYDRFRSRLMFPIRDERGDLVAFGGRLLGDGTPKYINSSDTPLYRKSRVLYGMDRARDAMSKSRQAVLVEGYLDVIACHRSGVDTAVASLGTALSEDHAKLLKRWVAEVVILYDSDEAGQKAADRAITILEEEGLQVRVALMPTGEDPDTLLRASGPEAVRQSVTRGVTPTAFRLAALEKRLHPDQEQFWQEAFVILASARHEIEVEGHLPRLASMYPGLRDVSAAVNQLRRGIARVRGDRPRKTSARAPAAREFVPLKEELTSAEMVVFAALHEPDFRRYAWMTIVRQPEVFATGRGAALAAAIAEAFPDAPPDDSASIWIHHVEPEECRQLLGDVLLDLRNANLTERLVADSIKALHEQSERRKLNRDKQGDLTSDQRQEILRRLKRMQGPPVPSNPIPSDPFL